MSLPRILVIDDQLGGVRDDGRNRLREDFCVAVGLTDVTGDVAVERTETPIAEVVFCGGQAVEDERVRNDLAGTLKVVRAGWQEWPRWALLLLDMQFRTGPPDAKGEPTLQASDGSPDRPEGYFGLTVLQEIWREPSLRDIPMVILSAMPRAQIERQFADHGVFEFVDKPRLNRERLGGLLRDHGLVESRDLIGRSIPFLRCLREARQRARPGNDNILLLGETGTGKELLAKYIHDQSPRRGRNYVTVYTQGRPETLVEDMLFGHEPGAYTGAKGKVPGAAEEASGGTLFIDEFGDITTATQSKLLRLLDKNTRETQRLGAKPDEVRRIPILQVVLATERLDILGSDKFRQALLFRVGIRDAIHVPPLRDRKEDIPLLVEYFVRKCERELKNSLGAEPRAISEDALALLTGTDWPGNVRDLEQAIESAIKRFPRIRVLSAGHLRLPTTASSPGSARKEKDRLDQTTPAALPPAASLDRVLRAVASLEFSEDADRRSEWVGKLPELRATFARTAARLLKAALLATRKATAKNPKGEINIQRAVHLAMGDDTLKHRKPADIVTRILSIDPGLHDEIMADPVLKEAYERTAGRRRKGEVHSKRKEDGG